MPEEDKKPEEKQVEKENKESKQAKAPEKKTVAEEKKEPAAKKKKKINRLTLKELEKKIEQVQQKMGGLSSAYAQQLLRRKDHLLQENKTEENLESGGENATNT